MRSMGDLGLALQSHRQNRRAVGEIPVEIVDDAVGLIRLSNHVDDEIGAHGRPEHQPTAFGHIRFARLAVMGDHHGPVPFGIEG